YKIKERLKDSNIIPTYYGFKKPRDSLLLPSYVYDLLNDDEIPKNLKISGTHYTIHREAAKHIERLIKTRDMLRGININVLTLSHIIANVPNRVSIEDVYKSIIDRLDSAESYKKLFLYILENERMDARTYSSKLLDNLVLLTESGKKGFLSRRAYLRYSQSYLSEVFALPFQEVQKFVVNKEMLKNLFDRYGADKVVHHELLDLLKLFLSELGYTLVTRSDRRDDLNHEIKGSENAIKRFFESLQNQIKDEVSKLANDLDKAINNNNMCEVLDITKNLLDYFLASKKVFETEEIKKKVKFKVEGKTEFRTAAGLLLPQSETHRLSEIFRQIDSYLQKGCKPLRAYREVKELVVFPDLTFYKGLDESTLLSFIRTLGGDRILDDVSVKRKVIDGIGLQAVAIREWRRHMCEIKEVYGRSHDLEVEEKGLYIEVKSTSHSLDEEVELRRGQIDALINDANTHLYIITEVLSNPRLFIADRNLIRNSLDGASIKVKARELVGRPPVQPEDVLL
ncbi:MAG: hypothetical protein QW193_05815, partial [Nitrososphaerales archaeon]